MPLDLNTSITTLKTRVDKTLSVQTAIAADWLWPLRSLADWQADSLALDKSQPDTLAAKAVDANTVADGARGRINVRLAEMHRQTVAVVGVMRVRAARDPSLAEVVDELSARAEGRENIEAEGVAALSAWKLMFGGAALVPAPGITYAGFQKLMYGDAAAVPPVPSLRDLKEELSDAQTLENGAVGKLNLLMNRAEEDCEDWYAEATKVYPIGTAHGDLIRSEVPTSYTGGNGGGSGNGGTPPPPPAVPGAPQNMALVEGASGSGEAGLNSDGSSGTVDGYKLFNNGVEVASSATLPVMATFTPGEALNLTLRAFNAGGESDPSDTISATAP